MLIRVAEAGFGLALLTAAVLIVAKLVTVSKLMQSFFVVVCAFVQCSGWDGMDLVGLTAAII